MSAVARYLMLMVVLARLSQVIVCLKVVMETAALKSIVEAPNEVRRLGREYLLSLDHVARSTLLREGPAVLENMIDDWPGLTVDKATWSDQDRFMRRYGHHILDPHPCKPEGQAKGCRRLKYPLWKLAQMQEFIIVPDGGYTKCAQMYLRDLFNNHPPPEILRSVTLLGHSIGVMSRVGVGISQHGPAWLALVAGVKLWFLAPPHLPKPVSPDCHNLELSAKNAQRDGVVRQLQLPGQIVYFPHNWWHATCNLSPFTPALGGFVGEELYLFLTEAERKTMHMSSGLLQYQRILGLKHREPGTSPSHQPNVTTTWFASTAWSPLPAQLQIWHLCIGWTGLGGVILGMRACMRRSRKAELIDNTKSI